MAWKIALFVLAAVARRIPHPWNITPVGGVGLFAGANMPLWQAALITLGPVLLVDAFIGFYSPISMVFVYAGLLMAPLMGRLLIGKRRTVLRIGSGVGANAVLFYLISNFGVWAAGYYPATLEGLMACYVAALPFIAYSLLGDSLYAGLLFGGQALYQRWRGVETAQA